MQVKSNTSLALNKFTISKKKKGLVTHHFLALKGEQEEEEGRGQKGEEGKGEERRGSSSSGHRGSRQLITFEVLPDDLTAGDQGKLAQRACKALISTLTSTRRGNT